MFKCKCYIGNVTRYFVSPHPFSLEFFNDVGFPPPFQYQDEEGDIITIYSNLELQEAFRVAQELDITLKVFLGHCPGKSLPVIMSDQEELAQARAKSGIVDETEDLKGLKLAEEKHKIQAELDCEMKQVADAISNSLSVERQTKIPTLDELFLGTPFDHIYAKHHTRIVQTFNDYYSSMADEFNEHQHQLSKLLHRTREMIQTVIAEEMQEPGAPTDQKLAVFDRDGELAKVVLVAEELETIIQEGQASFSRRAGVIVGRLDEYLSSLPPCQYLQPAHVVISVAGLSPKFRLKAPAITAFPDIRAFIVMKLQQAGFQDVIYEGSQFLVLRPIPTEGFLATDETPSDGSFLTGTHSLHLHKNDAQLSSHIHSVLPTSQLSLDDILSSVSNPSQCKQIWIAPEEEHHILIGELGLPVVTDVWNANHTSLGGSSTSAAELILCGVKVGQGQSQGDFEKIQRKKTGDGRRGCFTPSSPPPLACR